MFFFLPLFIAHPFAFLNVGVDVGVDDKGVLAERLLNSADGDVHPSIRKN